MYANIQTEVRAGVGTVKLNRADRHNAFDAATIAELTAAFTAFADDPAVRIVVLASTGKSFCAGADLNWMKAAAAQGYDDNLQDARNLAGMLHRLAALPKPTVARVQGPAYGGGVGLVAACDIAIACADARFALSEVRLGLIPSTIGPHVVAAIGARHAKRYMLSAESFGAADAQAMGLIHEVVADVVALDAAVTRLAAALLQNGPEALAACKELVADIARQPLSPELIEDTARRIATTRAGAEAREGIAAFLERRKPGWIAEN